MGLPVILIAPGGLEVQATVVSKMLEQVGFQVTRQILEPEVFNRQTVLSHLDQPPENQAWDIAPTLSNPSQEKFDKDDRPLPQTSAGF
jgi:hypothetical protein